MTTSRDSGEIPATAINSLMRNDYRDSVIRTIVQYLHTPGKKMQLDPSVRRHILVDGYRKLPEQAPAPKLIPAALKAFKKHSDVTAAFLNIWVNARPDLGNAMRGFLTEKGVHLNNTGELGTSFSGIHSSDVMSGHIESFLVEFSEFSKDDAILMYICLQGTLPQKDDDLVTELENKELNRALTLDDVSRLVKDLKESQFDQKTLDLVDKLISELRALRKTMADRIGKISNLDSLIANFRKNVHDEIKSHELEESGKWEARHCVPDMIPKTEAAIVELENGLKHYQSLWSNQPKAVKEQRNWRQQLDDLDNQISDLYKQLNLTLIPNLETADCVDGQSGPAEAVDGIDAATAVPQRSAGEIGFSDRQNQSQTTICLSESIVHDSSGDEDRSDASPAHLLTTAGLRESTHSVQSSQAPCEKTGFGDVIGLPSEDVEVEYREPRQQDADNDQSTDFEEHQESEKDLTKPFPVPETRDVLSTAPKRTTQELAHHWPPDQNSRSIAAAILDKDSGEKLEYLRDLVWKLIEENRAGLACHLGAHLESQGVEPHLPVWLLEALAVANHIQFPNSELATKSIVELSKYSGKVFRVALTEWNHAIRFLLVAAALRPAILASCNSCAGPLLETHKKEGLESFFEYCQFVGEFAKRSRPLNPLLLLNESQRNDERQKLKSEIEMWWQQAPLTTVNYPSATRVWKYWLEKGHLLESLISAVRSNDMKSVQRIKSEVERLSTDKEVRKEIHQTYQTIRTKTSVDRLQGKTINQLSQYLTKPLDLCDRWLRLFDPVRPSAEIASETSRSKEVYAVVSRLTKKVETEINRFIATNRDSLLIRSSGTACLRSIRGLFDIVCDENQKLEPEIPKKYIFNSDFLRIAGLELNEQWYPEGQDEKLPDLILNMIANANSGWETAFEAHSTGRDHAATERILEYLKATDEKDVDTDRLEMERTRHLEECRDLLERDVQDTIKKIESAVAHGLLAEKDRSPRSSKVEGIRRSIPKIANFNPYFRELIQLRAEIEDLNHRETDKVRKRLNEAPIGIDTKEYALISEKIGEGDVLTANEYIDFVSAGQGIPVPEEKEHTFTNFFPGKLIELDDYLAGKGGGRRSIESVDARTIIHKTKHRSGIPGVNMKRVTGTQANEAAEMMEAWFTIKRQRRIVDSSLNTILIRLGFNPEAVVQNQVGRDQWIDLSTTIINDRRQIPVPFYGSDAKGRYRILCLWDKQGADEVARIVSENYHGSPIMVFYFGRMTEGRRRDLAQISIERRKTFIVVDEIVMLYICGERGSRLRSLIECTLPFTFLEPFTTTAGLVSPEMFFGRKVERETIMNPKGACFLYGGRQLGKTALLRDVVRRFHDPQKGRIAIWLDLKEEGIGLDRPLNWIWNLITVNLTKHGVISGHLPSNTGPDKIFEKIENWLQEDAERMILLMLDEADRFLTSDAQETSSRTREGFVRVGNLKGWMDKTERRFKVVFAGLHNVQRTTKQSNQPLAHFDDPICIGPLLDNGEWREARSLIEQPFENMGFEFESNDLVTRILSRTNYYPNLIQLYCKHLLRQLTNSNISNFDPKSSPPYKISSYHVDRAYSDEELYKAIRDRFMLTLNLDGRYRVIAYSIALYDSPGEGLDVDRIRREALFWWPKGFEKSASEDAFRVLLDEMVGLGVLRVSSPNSYALRSPNVISLMGSDEDISKALEESSANEPPAEYDAIYYRAALRTKNGVNPSKRSPLTAQQDSELRAKNFGVSVVFGTPASGIEDVEKFLNAEAHEGFVSFAGTTERNAFLEELEKALRKGTKAKETNTIGFVPSTVPWSEIWISDALGRLRKLRSQVSFFRLIFSAGPKSTWGLLRDSPGSLEVLKRSGITVFSLQPWGDLAVRQWLEDCGFAKNDSEGRQLIELATGNWPLLLERFYQMCRVEPHKLDDHLNKFDRLFDDSEFLSMASESLGLNIDAPRQVLTNLSILGEAGLEDLVEVSQELNSEVVQNSLKWAELLSLVKDTGGGIYRSDRLVNRVLKSMSRGC